MATTETQIVVNTNLQKQDLNNLEVNNLTPLSPEVISRQATINIGTIGHVAHGKSTVVKAISGVQTVRFKNELERNITIKLERISLQRMKALLASPRLLREFEESQELKQLQRQHLNRQQYNYNSFHWLACPLPRTPLDATQTRLNALTPSSGYESFNDNSSTHSGESMKISARECLAKKQRKPVKRHNKLKTPSQSLSLKKGLFSNATAIRKSQQEYVIEEIECVESLNGQPVFYVKWLNYSRDQNTWEDLDNISECSLLDDFIDHYTSLYRHSIVCIINEAQQNIIKENLTLDPKELDVRELDKYDEHMIKLEVDLILLAQFEASRSRNYRDSQKIRKRILRALLLKPWFIQRKQQQISLLQWQDHANLVEGNAPIKVENNVDLDVLDPNFKYICENLAGKGVAIGNEPPVGCNCLDGCKPLATKCCARMADGYFAYDKKERLRIKPREAIYECNKSCQCPIDCPNRVIQRGRRNALSLFKTSNGCGWGVRTDKAMCKGEYVCEYVGEIITVEEANERGKRYDTIGRTYLFDLDYDTSSDTKYTIDAAQYGNIGHFVNHSCDPNLGVYSFWIDNLDIKMPRLAFFTLRLIKAGEELSFDYIQNAPDLDDYENLSNAEKITCRCGYANAKIYQCDNPKCPRPACFISDSSSKDDNFPCSRPSCTGRFRLVRHVSFVDCPGHDILMATMLNGAAVMDAALLLIAGNESCPQPQTSEHLAAIEIMKLKQILILQNKIDLVKESQAKEQYEDITKFVKGTVADGAPIIPISAQLKYNIDVLCEYIVKKIPVPQRDFSSPPRLIVIRSFDVNKPGCEVKDLKGGVAGGSILCGVLKVGQEIEVRPGVVTKDGDGNITCRPIFSRIVSLYAEQNELQYAVPGGLIGVGTKIDPTLCRADRLVGQVLGAVGHLPDIYIELEISYYLLRRLLGVRTDGDKKGARVDKLKKTEILLVNIGSLSTGGRISATQGDLAKIVLTTPVCTQKGEKIALSRRVEKHWRLIGWGQIFGGKTIQPVIDRQAPIEK
ncbi:hypothetical protein GQX74_000299 [Glossina fuscipes]|nr:hypothetical protein GQX74_000299 [Glossina fuscipes]